MTAPRFLAGFHGALTDEERHDHFSISNYAVCCKDCGADMFDVLPVRSEWQPGAVDEFAIQLLCCGCGARKLLFDAARDGYDGECGHLKFLHGEKLETRTLKSGVLVRVRLAYNIEAAELEEHARELGLAPHDLFDWFYVLCRESLPDEWQDVWNYECA